MKINLNALREYISLPDSQDELQDIMEDLGLEVKSASTTEDGPVFTLELLANRGDHHCYQGVARELHGRTEWPLAEIVTKDLPAIENSELVTVTSDLCINYTLTPFACGTESSGKALTEVQAQMVRSSGNNIITPVVDLTNFINVEIGQPLHVFDADKVVGKITVRETEEGEQALLLFHDEPVSLPKGTLVIADAKKILAVAGVMGCEECKPTDETRRVYLECATFDPVAVRKAAKHLRVQSLSSMRFERGSDPEMALQAIKRAAVIFEQIGWQSEGSTMIAKYTNYEPSTIKLNIDDIFQYFDTTFATSDIVGVLTRYGFEVDFSDSSGELNIRVPSYRKWDVLDRNDILEEVGRGIGYNRMPASLPPLSSAILPSQQMTKKILIEELLVHEGFFEVFTNGFYSSKHRTDLGINEQSPLWQHVNVINSEEKSYSLLKNNCLAQALEIVQTNLHVKNFDVKAYEWAKVFLPDADAGNGLCREQSLLWMVVNGQSRAQNWQDSGRQADVFYLKGLVEEVSNILDLQLTVLQTSPEEDIWKKFPVSECLHPHRRAVILCQEEPVGVLGQLHPRTLSTWGVKNAEPCYMELSQDILNKPPLPRKYVAPSSSQTIIRDVCLVLPDRLASESIISYMCHQSAWLKEVAVTDVFNSESTNHLNAVTFSLCYSLDQAGRSQLTGEEINGETERVLQSLIEHFSSFGITRR